MFRLARVSRATPTISLRATAGAASPIAFPAGTIGDLLKLKPCLALGARTVATTTVPPASNSDVITGSQSTRPQKTDGTIQALFSSLNPLITHTLPDRFSDLKKELWRDVLIESWREVLGELEVRTEEIVERGSEMIPRVSYEELSGPGGLKGEKLDQVKKTGVVVVTGAVPKEEALSWKKMIQDYAALNKDLVRGFPEHDVQVFELYNTKSQTLARTHPSILQTQKSLLSLWHTNTTTTNTTTNTSPSSEISLTTPISYFDRLRIRKPGDTTFTLGPHIDGGAIERWEDEGFRACWGKILSGRWRDHDSFDAGVRLGVRQDMYNAPNQCSVFRPWQGWTSMSSTGPNEGTLRVLPMLSLTTAYLILRPFFRARNRNGSLRFGNWDVLDLDSSVFPGSGMGTAQELNEETHPHLRLGRTMTSVPRVEPGDQVYWHCDVVHAVEFEHKGKGDSSVMYIPAVPLTTFNAGYLRDQRINFIKGLPAPDFPGGEGESRFIGRGGIEDIKKTNRKGLQAYGFEPFDVEYPEESEFVRKVNKIVGAA